jgi:anhydro-N-acetylmuramic acid kinase
VSRWAIGLMSGTSVDGVDAVLACFDGQGPHTRIHTAAQAARPMPAALRASLLALQQPGPDELARAADASRDLTDLYAEVVSDLLGSINSRNSRNAADQPTGLPAADLSGRPSDSLSGSPSGKAKPDTPASIVIGAHGQTVRHRPERGYTLQLIDGARLAERTGLAVVTDFRSADIAAGGQGAPLVPAFHALAFASATHRRAIINIGGIANVSLLPTVQYNDPQASVDRRAPEPIESVTGFDTGPGNLLMDLWCERHTGQPYDAGGHWGAAGQIDQALLAHCLEEPYFSLPAPKSTGRDLFTQQWLDTALQGAPLRKAQDVQATLAELTAVLIAQACNGFGATECFVCGGGAFNQHLMERLSALMPQSAVQTTAALGVPPDAVEALAFAWLARQRLLNKPANLPAVTGARGPRTLGAVYAAPDSLV